MDKREWHLSLLERGNLIIESTSCVAVAPLWAPSGWNELGTSCWFFTNGIRPDGGGEGLDALDAFSKLMDLPCVLLPGRMDSCIRCFAVNF